MNCEHTWVPFTNVPLGENPKKYLQCSGCAVIGYTKANPLSGQKGKTVFVYRCHLEGCRKDAISRLTGRGTRGALLWVCSEHQKKD